MQPSIIVHGGAWDIPDDQVDRHVSGCQRAAARANDVLTVGGCALDAVEEAVVVMEDDPIFDAGKGSVLNQMGFVEMDAIIMDGRTLRSGSVAALRNVRNPIRVARRLMDTTHFSMVAGHGALRFAQSNGFETCPDEELLVGWELDDYMEFQRTGVLRTREEFEGGGCDTVGACAIDSQGHVACATSTGGTRRKIEGRVGDSPLIGSGGYADDRTGAASATGWGEKIMAVVMSKSGLDLLGEDLAPDSACEGAVRILKERVDGLGGLIMVDTKGRIGFAYNTPRMAFAYHEGLTGRSFAGVRR